MYDDNLAVCQKISKKSTRNCQHVGVCFQKLSVFEMLCRLLRVKDVFMFKN